MKKKTSKKAVVDGSRLTERFEIRLTPEEKTKLMALGSAAWVRERIRLAKDPA